MFESDDLLYYYDTGTGKVINVDYYINKIIKRLFTYEDNVDSFIKYMKDEGISNENLREFIEFVYEEDLLKGVDIDNLYTAEYLQYVKNQVNNNCGQLILELTGRCNLRCKYCIYNDSYENMRNFNCNDMTTDVIRKAIDYVKEHSKDEVDITFYGGEPLLRFEEMKYAIEYAKETIKDKVINYGFTTNLTLLNEEIAKYLASVGNMHILCSIDGPEDAHDRCRVFKNGEGTHKQVMKNFDILVNAFKNAENSTIKVNSVLTPPFTFEKMNYINNYFNKFKNKIKDFSVEITYPVDGSLPEEFYDETLQVSNVIDRWNKDSFYKKHDTCMNEEMVWKDLFRIHNRLITQQASNWVPFNACCIPGERRIYVDTEGYIYPCERIGRAPILGHVDYGIKLDELLKNYIIDYSKKSIDSCKNCWAVKMCPICYVNRMTEEGISESAHLNCELYRQAIKSDLSFYHSMLRNKPEHLKKINEMSYY